MKTLTFAETLHPETAEVHMAHVVADENGVKVSRWETFFNAARGDIPIAVAVAEKIEEGDPGISYAAGVVTNDSPQHVQQNSSRDTTNFPNARHQLGKTCFYLEGLIGGILTIAAVSGVFATELAGVIVYFLAVGFHYLASRDWMPHILEHIFRLIMNVLMVTDAICLFASVMISESIGFATGIVMLIVCCSTGNSYQIAQEWHQYIRIVCHLTRWTLRSFHQGWAPERVFPLELSAPKSSSSESPVDNQSGGRLKPDGSDGSTRRFDSNGSSVFESSLDPPKVDTSLEPIVLPAEATFTSVASAPMAPDEERDHSIFLTEDMVVVDLESNSDHIHGYVEKGEKKK